MNWQEHFPGFEKELLDLISNEAVFKSVKAGEVIMRTGQYIKSTVLLIEGRIKIYRENEDGGEFLMYYLSPGEACAVSLICAIQQDSSEITAIAEEDSELLLLPVQLMDSMMTKYKSWYQFVIRTYRSRFDEMLSVIDNVAFRNMDERLEFYLKRHIATTGKTSIELSHQQIADDLHTSREVISRLLKKMEQRGYLELGRSSIVLKSTE